MIPDFLQVIHARVGNLRDQNQGCDGGRALDTYSLVTAPYGVGGRVLGVLGVIGPTRMAYERVIPVVQATAQIISGALKRAQPTL